MTGTEMSSGADANKEFLAQRAARIPLRRLGAVQDAADVVAFLLSDEASYVTGQVVGVDGGLNDSL